jgi:hypothetical protein
MRGDRNRGMARTVAAALIDRLAAEIAGSSGERRCADAIVVARLLAAYRL